MSTTAVKGIQSRRKKRKISWRKLLVRILLLVFCVMIWKTVTTLLTVPLDKPLEITRDGKILSVVDSDSENFQSVQLLPENIHQGNLILVNNETTFDFEHNGEQLVGLLENRQGDYQVKDQTVLVDQQIIPMLDRMLADFRAKYPNHALNVISGYRSYELQQSLLDREIAQSGEQEARRWVALPGNSEHHTGLAMDFGLYYPDGTSGEYDGTGDYSWISENCYRYGYVLRYAKEKETVTGIAYEPWHFRYVGLAHAYVMKEQNFCLEEYLEWLEQYSFSGQHLLIHCEDRQYEVYYQQGTEIFVPKDREYEISGNNTDGFIITSEVL